MRTVTLKDYCISIYCSTLPSQPKESENGMLAISPVSIENGRIDFSKYMKVSTDSYRNLERSIPKKWDVLISYRGSTCGKKICIVKEDRTFIAQGFMLLRCHSEIESRWLYHFLNSDIIQKRLANQRKGSTIPYLTKETFEDLDIILPDEETMRREISALDSLEEYRYTCLKKLNAIDDIYRTLLCKYQ